MKDMNIAKLSSVDVPLFNGIVSDLFPGVESPVIDYTKVSLCVSLSLSHCLCLSLVSLDIGSDSN